jgi:ABC-type transport system involved in multi-copper enzyme maturation permease subunit
VKALAVTISTFIPLIFVAGVIAIVLVVILTSSGKTKQISKYRSSPKHQHYISGEFSSQMELDLRLPYRRFKQLYPNNRLTYQQYKDLQMRSSFRRSMSSQDNSRMVR